MTRRITPKTTIENLRKEAKRRLKALRANDAEARARLERAFPKAAKHPVLRDVQHALALEYGFPDWKALKAAVNGVRQNEPTGPAPADVSTYELLARDMVTAYETGDAASMQRINEHYGWTSTVDDLRATVWRLVYDDEALSVLPLFPALRELTPIGVKDEGFRHVGRCERLERLTCMYCRDTPDLATGHIAGLRLKYYYAGLTQITDLSLEILGRLTSLETVDLFETKLVTDAGLAYLQTCRACARSISAACQTSHWPEPERFRRTYA